jgi:hypothetical protein
LQIAAIISTRFDVCGSFQVLVWRPTHPSDADNYLEQSPGKIVRWRNMENLTLTFPVLSDDSAFGCIRLGAQWLIWQSEVSNPIASIFV